MDHDREYNLTLVAIGGNLASQKDSPIELVQQGLAAVRALAVDDFRASRLFRTPAFPLGSGPDFVNAAMSFFSDMDPQTLLEALHEIEAAAGRTRAQRWEARLLDLDLLAVGGEVLPDGAGFRHWAGLDQAAQQSAAPQELILPHPRLHERSFVLMPLLDVAPDWLHPVLGRSVRQMCAALPAAEVAQVVPIAPGAAWTA